MVISTYEVKTENDIEKLIELNGTSLSGSLNKERFKSDFQKGFFRCLFSVESSELDNKSIIGYVLFYNSYSTWQNRVLYISKIWLNSKYSEQNKLASLISLRDTLFLICRQNNYMRINLNLRHNEENQNLIEWLVIPEVGSVNLTKHEDWLLFEMGLNEMKLFLNNNQTIDSKYKVKKVVDMSEYCESIKGLIRELAIYEKLEDQFKLSADDMIKDYSYEEFISFDGSKHLNRFYEAMVVSEEKLNKETNQIEQSVIGFAIYYLNYEVERGRGCYLEDLYIQESYRRNGLGTYLWQKVIEDCLLNHNVNFMQWSVLAWNKPAIKFYYKYQSTNLTNSSLNLNLYRFVTETIYSNKTN